MWKLVRLDRRRQFTRGSTCDLRPKPAENKQSQRAREREREIKRFVNPTPVFFLFIVLPFFCSQLVCFSLFIPHLSRMLLVVFVLFFFFLCISLPVFPTNSNMSSTETEIQSELSHPVSSFFHIF